VPNIVTQEYQDVVNSHPMFVAVHGGSFFPNGENISYRLILGSTVQRCQRPRCTGSFRDRSPFFTRTLHLFSNVNLSPGHAWI